MLEKQTATIATDLIRDAEYAIDWFEHFWNDVHAVCPEYAERCGDYASARYLIEEAQSIRNRLAYCRVGQQERPE